MASGLTSSFTTIVFKVWTVLQASAFCDTLQSLRTSSIEHSKIRNQSISHPFEILSNQQLVRIAHKISVISDFAAIAIQITRLFLVSRGEASL